MAIENVKTWPGDDQPLDAARLPQNQLESFEQSPEESKPG